MTMTSAIQLLRDHYITCQPVGPGTIAAISVSGRDNVFTEETVYLPTSSRAIRDWLGN